MFLKLWWAYIWEFNNVPSKAKVIEINFTKKDQFLAQVNNLTNVYVSVIIRIM